MRCAYIEPARDKKAREYTLVRSNRRSVAIYIRGGGLEVRAPLKAPISEIDRFIASKEKWITEKLASSNEQAKARAGFKLGFGSLIPYRGKRYPIEAREGGRAGFDGACFFMPPYVRPVQMKDVCVKTYRLLAKIRLGARALECAALMSSQPPAAIKITGARTRWGSCSSKKTVNFSWRLILAPDEIVDYVVIHELAHLSELNHSAKFWNIVEAALPDYRDRKKLLREHQRALGIENW